MGLNVGRHSFIDEVWDEARKVVAVIFLKYFFHLQIKQVYVSCYFRVVSEAQRFSICSECKQIKTFLAKVHACAVHTHYERKNLSFWWRYKSFCLPLQYTVNMYGNGDTASAFFYHCLYLLYSIVHRSHFLPCFLSLCHWCQGEWHRLLCKRHKLFASNCQANCLTIMCWKASAVNWWVRYPLWKC